MQAAHRAMEEIYDAQYVSLHVRAGNRGAFTLYNQTLGYKIHDTEIAYYADGENAYDMRLYFKKKVVEEVKAVEETKTPAPAAEEPAKKKRSRRKKKN
mmetsp:Transcript_3281/g.6772  ORF Transcript_3281/g.6772 Transcript_3281/m.6772 type:complete len:98 (-) Transcript_3281:45-338(-)